MRRPSILIGALLGGLFSLPLIALSYLGQKLAGLPFIPFDIFDWLARILPGRVITTGIDTIVRTITLLGLGPIAGTAKRIEQTLGILLLVAAGVVLGAAIAYFMRYGRRPGRTVGVIAGFVAFLVVTGVEIGLHGADLANPVAALAWIAILTIGWGALVGTYVGDEAIAGAEPAPAAGPGISRRTLLVRLAGGSIGLAAAAWGVGRLSQASRPSTAVGQGLPGSQPAAPLPSGVGAAATPAPLAAASTPPPGATAAATTRDRIAPAPGTRPELTSNKDFYRIDINLAPPSVDGPSWVLQVSGLFDRPRPLRISDFLAYPAVTQTITQSCISNPVGGDLIGTTNYTGARVRDVLKDLGMQPKATALQIKSADGFYESVVMEDLLDPRTLFVYGMNGETLPVEHGFPLRIYIPNRYGMKQPKWITSVEAIGERGPGYWVDRGWSLEARPQIVSVIDAVARDKVENGRVPVGGIAWAGDRGIRKVEVQVDDGEWAEAVLRTPPLSPLTWVEWRYDWPAQPGTHKFQVRATDGTGALQVERTADTYPDGATGYDSNVATISG